MKYCEKFYELASVAKDRADENGRKLFLYGEVESPFGVIPKCIFYTGEFMDIMPRIMIEINRMLFSKWDIEDGQCCISDTFDGDEPGAIPWEK